MRRFKVKELLISPAVPVLLDVPGPCAPGNNVTNHGCFQASVFPCRDDALPKTETPCAVYSDTKRGCVDGAYATLRACIIGVTRDQKNPCARKCKQQTQQPQPTDTHFLCVCKAGIPTIDPQTNPQFDTRKPCAVESETLFECAENSNTVRSCQLRQPREERTKFWCDIRPGGSLTRRECKGIDTQFRECDVGKPRTDFPRGYTPYAGFRGEQGIGNIGCPPLSPLDLPVHNPLALDALLLLRADLREALRQVDARTQEIGPALEPQNLGEVKFLEHGLTEALEELRKLKDGLTRKKPKKQAPTRGQPKKRPRKGE